MITDKPALNLDTSCNVSLEDTDRKLENEEKNLITAIMVIGTSGQEDDTMTSDHANSDDLTIKKKTQNDQNFRNLAIQDNCFYATKDIAGYDGITHLLKTHSLALKIGTYLRNCATCTIRTRNKLLREDRGGLNSCSADTRGKQKEQIKTYSIDLRLHNIDRVSEEERQRCIKRSGN
ncbi:unnamed protein product [Mytilus edulis]|uniref:Uncharacterized protein n=1 Tax=Mytilus edulis TaxID=6550 RepID=A0A8S3TSH3_MYTED|nr:unnamed protein product [Mytilus edulis]